MNKTELVETIAQRTDVAKKDVQAVLDTFEDIAGEVVAKGKEALTIPGFLKFERTKRAARTGRNPQTGETIQVAATHAAKVTAGAKLKARAKAGK
jgi:DNA-binding protein HU-beta